MNRSSSAARRFSGFKFLCSVVARAACAVLHVRVVLLNKTYRLLHSFVVLFPG